MAAEVVLLSLQALDRHADALTRLLQDTVAGGGGIGFFAPLPEEAARAYWAGVRAEVEARHRIVVALVEADQVIGCVQLALAQRATGVHRADVQKLMVSKEHRRRGLATRLMAAAEAEARRSGRTLLLLDTFSGSEGDALYQKLGWTRIGEIPRYAAYPHGGLGTLALFYKELAAGQE